eukprot:1758853-Pyramimonas_sp.AAC.1
MRAPPGPPHWTGAHQLGRRQAVQKLLELCHRAWNNLPGRELANPRGEAPMAPQLHWALILGKDKKPPFRQPNLCAIKWPTTECSFICRHAPMNTAMGFLPCHLSCLSL